MTCANCHDHIQGPLAQSLAPEYQRNGNAYFACMRCHLKLDAAAFKRGQKGLFQPLPGTDKAMDGDVCGHPWKIYFENYRNGGQPGAGSSANETMEAQPMDAAEHQALLKAWKTTPGKASSSFLSRLRRS